MACKGLHFGAFEVNLEVHELRKHGLRIRLSEQPFRALVMLLEHQAEVVTREELRKALWPDQNFGDLDHRLNKTINQIREALGDSADRPRFLETLPRIGYRFLAPVGPLPSGVAPSAPPAVLPPAPAPSRSFRWPLVGAILAATVLGFGIPMAFRVSARKAAPNYPVSESTPLTTYLGSELYPCFSPDGKQVAFAWDGESQKVFHVFVTSVVPGTPRQLTDGNASDSGPAWSPDGRAIAFLREAHAGQAELRLVRPDGTGERKIADLTPARTDHPIAWTRDSRWLVVAANPPGDGPPALFLFSVQTGERRRLTSPPVQSGGDHSPALSPDGTLLAFTRWTTATWRDIFVVPLSGDMAPSAEPVRITDLHRLIDTIAWSADGRTIYFAAAATLAGARYLFRVNAAPTPPNGGFVEFGIEGSYPAASPNGRDLIYVRKNIEQTDTWRVQPPSAGSTAAPRWTRLMSSTRRDFTVDISPDGKRLVFSSVRSGPTEIWVSNLDGSGLSRMASLGATPRWSPDGRRIVFESVADGESTICTIEVATGAMLRLTNTPGADISPTWSRDGRFVYFSSDRSGKAQIWKVPSTGGKAVQITRSGGFYAIETFDGRRIFYTTSGQPSAVHTAPADGGEETEVLPNVVGWSSIAMAPDGLYYLSSLDSSGAQLDFYDFARHTSRAIVSIEHPVHHMLSSPPDGRSVVFTQVGRQDNDLMLVHVK